MRDIQGRDSNPHSEEKKKDNSLEGESTRDDTGRKGITSKLDDNGPKNSPTIVSKVNAVPLQSLKANGLKRAPVLTGVRKNSETQILRFKESERWLHWGIAVPFMVCWVTGLVLAVIYYPEPQLPLRAAFSWLHRISGVSLVVLPLVSFVRGRKDLRMHFYNIRTAWSWSVDDLKWIALMLPATVSKKFVLPDQDKFNAAEKVNFVSGMLGLPLLIISSTLVWFHQWAWQAWLVHAAAAILMTPIILGHVFMATLDPDTKVGLSGMISGYVNPQWAKHHYAVWYGEHFEKALPSVKADARVYRPQFQRAYVHCPFCARNLSITRAGLIKAVMSAKSLECPSCHNLLAALSLVEDEQVLRWALNEFEKRGKPAIRYTCGEPESEIRWWNLMSKTEIARSSL